MGAQAGRDQEHPKGQWAIQATSSPSYHDAQGQANGQATGAPNEARRTPFGPGTDPTTDLNYLLVKTPKTAFKTDRVKITLATNVILGWNEIDAVQLVGSDQWSSGGHGFTACGKTLILSFRTESTE